MANGIQNMYLPVNGTAVAAQAANHLEVTHNVTGSAGWKKFLELTATYASGIFVQLLIKDTFSAPCGIANITISATTNPLTTTNTLVEIMWLHPGAIDDIRFSIDGLTVTFYINKRGAGSGVYQFIVLSSTIRDGSYYAIPSTAWKNEAVTLSDDWYKSTGIRAQYDSNGNQISTSYLPVNSVATAAKRLASSNSINGAGKWYDFLELPLQNFDIEILITETANNNTAGIFRAVYFTSGSYCKVNWMTYPPDYRRLCYEVASDKVIFYYYKGTASGYTLQFKVLSSTVGTSVLDLTDYWKAVGQSSTSVASPPANTIAAGIYGHYWGVCNTAAATAAKTVTIPNFPTNIPDGTEIRVYFTTDQSATSPTLNVNDIGAYPIRMFGVASSTYNVLVDYWAAGDYVTFVFNTTYSCWVVTGKSGKASLTNYGYTKLSSAIDSTSTDLAATPSAVKQAYDLAAAALPATSTALRANRLAGLHTLTGGSGWYKIMDFTIETSNNSSRNFVLVVMDTYQAYAGIVKINFRRTSASNIECEPQWIALNGYYLASFAYTVDGSTGKCELYFRKVTSGTYDTKFQCLASTSFVNWIDATAIPWYTAGASAPVSALPENAVISYVGNAADRATRLAPAKTFTGAAGWYKVLEVSLSTNTGYFGLFAISDYSYYTGIFNFYLIRTSSTASEASVRWHSITGGTDHINDIQYVKTMENGTATLSLYVRKRSGSSYGVSIDVLNSTSANGSSYTPQAWFIASPTSTTLPSTAVPAKPPTGILRYSTQTVSAGSNAQIMSISNNEISENHVLARIEWANPEYITTGYSWTTEAGAFKLTGTCTAATTANVLLVRKGN